MAPGPPLHRFPSYFIRDDDVGELTDDLRFFVETFVERQLPVSYQIIPARLTSDCAAYFKGLAARHSQLIEFGQHGLTHEMVVAGRVVYREFGPERSYEAQLSDILRGRDILHAQLGDDFPVVLFTPPQHKYDGNTIRAVAAAGHRVFSAASYRAPAHRVAYALGRGLGLSSIRHHGISYDGRRRPEADVHEVSISIAVDDGGDICCPAPGLPAALATAGTGGRRVGLMLHHAVYDTVERRQALEAIADLLAEQGSANFSLLTELASKA